MSHQVPVILFTYNRPDHLRRTLESLKTDKIPLLYIYSDGAKTRKDEAAVLEVRSVIRGIDWCRTIITERETNLGLGRSVLAGVTEVLEKEEMAIVFEDDLVSVPGTYQYLTAALERYRGDKQVMSVAGWNHERVTPADITDQPYFDGRTESWVWGTWARVWPEMAEKNSAALIRECRKEGIDIFRYGKDIPEMAQEESSRNIWWVRFMLLHMVHHGLCFRPPWSLVEHIGIDNAGTNVRDNDIWASEQLRSCPQIPAFWPDPVEHRDCPVLWQRCYGTRVSRFAWRVHFSIRKFAESLRVPGCKQEKE
jgi:hypothetical protein